MLPPSSSLPPLRVVLSSQVSALRALRLDEALLRAASGAWLVVHDGVEPEAIVVGLSGKPEELVHREEASSADVPLLRRFSGGGTVLLGPGCVWATLAGGEEHLPPEVAGRGPRPLMEWTERVWGPVFGRIGDFKLREHDYAFGDLKFGGNAQALSKKRWLHHSSLLWSVDPLRMRQLLKQPVRAPDYREGREHGSFLTSLEAQNELAKEKKKKKKKKRVSEEGGGDGTNKRSGGFFESRRHFVEALAPAVASVGGFSVVPTTLEEAEGMVAGVEHHRSTVVIEEE